MILNVNDYKLNKKVSDRTLLRNGFDKKGIYKCNLYKNLITLTIIINREHGVWDFTVKDEDHDCLYSGYYDTEFGRSNVVTQLNNKIDAIMDTFVEQKIFTKKRRKRNGKSRKVLQSK